MKRATICLLVVAAFHSVTAAQAPASRGLSAAWSLEGRWTGVVGDETSEAIYALGYGRGAEIDLAGQIRREFPIPFADGRMLRLGRFPRPTLLTFSVWSSDVNAYDLSGKRLWSYPRATGIDAVWPGDVDGDESDEVVVGYNGGTGVHVLDSQGQLRWKSTAIGNVWQVAVGDVLNDGRMEVVTTSAGGKVHVFGGDGQARLDLAAQRVYTTMVRVAKLRADDSVATILVAGNDLDSKAGAVMALSGDGASKWKLELPGSVHTAHVASARPWLALGTREGQVYVVNAVRGVILGVVDAQGSAEVGWVGNPPLLLVATGSSLNAFHVTAK